jgi:hypothetical protein
MGVASRGLRKPLFENLQIERYGMWHERARPRSSDRARADQRARHRQGRRCDRCGFDARAHDERMRLSTGSIHPAFRRRHVAASAKRSRDVLTVQRRLCVLRHRGRRVERRERGLDVRAALSGGRRDKRTSRVLSRAGRQHRNREARLRHDGSGPERRHERGEKRLGYSMPATILHR